MKKLLIIIIIILILAIISIDLYVVISTNNGIIKADDIKDNYDAIIVLGAGIRNNNPSPMLADRLLTAVDLYNKSVAPKILVSGDHEYEDHDEVNVMKKYLIEKGIPSEDIFMDHAGLSTYDSILRAKMVFEVNNALIVTQKYHLHRALYIASDNDLNAIGVSATKQRYHNQTKRDIREFVARIKDFFKCIANPEPTYLGDVIPINGNGDITNDNNS